MQAERTDDDRFFDWLAGLIDGEGSFQIQVAGKGVYRARFILQLRADDYAILKEVLRRTRLGRLDWNPARGPNRPQVRWEVSRKADCSRLATLLTKHPLRSKKARDFELWSRALKEWATITRAGGDWTVIAAIKAEMEAVRRYENSRPYRAGRAVLGTRRQYADLICEGCGGPFQRPLSKGQYATRCQWCIDESVIVLPTVSELPTVAVS